MRGVTFIVKLIGEQCGIAVFATITIVWWRITCDTFNIFWFIMATLKCAAQIFAYIRKTSSCLGNSLLSCRTIDYFVDIHYIGNDLKRGRLCDNITIPYLMRAHTFFVNQLLQSFKWLHEGFDSESSWRRLAWTCFETCSFIIKQNGFSFRRADMLVAPAHLTSLVAVRICAAYLL